MTQTMTKWAAEGCWGAWLGAHRADEAANEEEEDFGRALDASRDNNDKHGAGQA